MGGRWYREKFGLEAPRILGAEIYDEDTGDWSFVLIGYGFLWKVLHTWAGHLATAHQMATLIKALSESRKLGYPGFQDFCMNNVAKEFAEAYGLAFSELCCRPPYTPLVRLPVTSNHPYRQDNKVRWLGMGNTASNTRA